MPTDLKSCPFCGCDDPSELYTTVLNAASNLRVGYCDNCGARGPAMATDAQAIEMWNRRVPDAAN